VSALIASVDTNLESSSSLRQDFILSILQASPSIRDSRSYLSSFAPPAPPKPTPILPDLFPEAILSLQNEPTKPINSLVTSLLDPTPRRPALVKIQGPFTDTQLNSVARGMARLQKLGLVSVIVVDRDDLPATEPDDPAAAQRQRTVMLRDLERVMQFLSRHKAQARPILATVVRVEGDGEGEVHVEEEGLDHVRRVLTEGEIPVLLPVALDAGCRSRRISSDKVLLALTRAMSTPTTTSTSTSRQIDLTPMRLLIINREGGIPSYARSGLPHLSINLASEYSYINNTFLSDWIESHPTALSNLALANSCLSLLPREASALIVSHRSSTALIANLITNKPVHSASLPHSLLTATDDRFTRDTPTLIRRGLPVRVLRSMNEVDQDKLTRLLEASFRRILNGKAFYDRLAKDLDFIIVIGDYVGAAVCTLEGPSSSHRSEKICYLDKFAVLPNHQGDGTVDFLWVALRDETYGLGLLDAANSSIGSLSGRGRGRDLVWRSRADNGVNKWYHERSSGFLHLSPPSLSGDDEGGLREGAGLGAGAGAGAGGKKAGVGWKMFWCDAEQRLRENAADDGREFGGGRLVRVIEKEEEGRLEKWAPVVQGIPSAWM